MLIEKAQEIIQTLRRHLVKTTGNTIPEIEIESSDRMQRTFGLAIAGDSLTIRLNNNRFKSHLNSDLFIQTVAHEFCHIVDYVLNGQMCHSKEWKKLMKLLGFEPRVYISQQEVESVTPKLYVHACNCKEHTVGHKTHIGIMLGYKVKCKLCQTNLKEAYELC